MTLRAVDRIIAAVITMLRSTGHRQVIAAHGVTRDTWLRAVAGCTGADAGMLLAAAERLVDMPAVTAWFHAGVLSWGAVRTTTRQVSRKNPPSGCGARSSAAMICSAVCTHRPYGTGDGWAVARADAYAG